MYYSLEVTCTTLAVSAETSLRECYLQKYKYSTATLGVTVRQKRKSCKVLL